MSKSVEPEAKRRKMKTTAQQYELYLNMLEQNSYFRENKMTPDRPDELMKCWEQLVENLNCTGGPRRTLLEWKRVFTDWKSQVRKRARTIKNVIHETWNIGEPEKELTELEKKLLYLTGEVAIKGIQGVPELGIHNESNMENASKEDQQENEKKERKKIIEHSSKKRDELHELNSNLKKLIQLKEEEVGLLKLKLQLKYNIQIDAETQDESA